MVKQKKEKTGMKLTNEVYVTHTCRNSKLSPKDPNYCDRAWGMWIKQKSGMYLQLGNTVLNARRRVLRILKQENQQKHLSR